MCESHVTQPSPFVDFVVLYTTFDLCSHHNRPLLALLLHTSVIFTSKLVSKESSGRLCYTFWPDPELQCCIFTGLCRISVTKYLHLPGIQFARLL